QPAHPAEAGRSTPAARGRAARCRGSSRAGSCRRDRELAAAPAPARFPTVVSSATFAPFAGASQIRFDGSDLSARKRTAAHPGAGRLPGSMIRVRALVLCLVALVAVTGCGSSPKKVTKAQYQAKLDTVGADLGRAGSQVGKAIDIATFNRDVENFQTHLRDAVKELKGVEPPPNAQEANTMLLNAFHDL